VKLAGLSLLTGALLLSHAAFAETLTYGGVLAEWGDRMKTVLDEAKTQAERERRMNELTKTAESNLSQTYCLSVDQAKKTSGAVSIASSTRKLPIGYFYEATCDLATHKMKVKFNISMFTSAKPDASVAAEATKIMDQFERGVSTSLSNQPGRNEKERVKLLKEDLLKHFGYAEQQLGHVPCQGTATSETFKVVKDLVESRTKKIANWYEDFTSTVDCKGGHVKVVFDLGLLHW
jgi:hypothetical protein